MILHFQWNVCCWGHLRYWVWRRFFLESVMTRRSIHDVTFQLFYKIMVFLLHGLYSVCISQEWKWQFYSHAFCFIIVVWYFTKERFWNLASVYANEWMNQSMTVNAIHKLPLHYWWTVSLESNWNRTSICTRVKGFSLTTDCDCRAPMQLKGLVYHRYTSTRTIEQKETKIYVSIYSKYMSNLDLGFTCILWLNIWAYRCLQGLFCMHPCSSTQVWFLIAPFGGLGRIKLWQLQLL